MQKEQHTPYFDIVEQIENNYEMVNHPNHYNKYSVEAFEMMRRIFYPNDDVGFANFCEATAFLYRIRLGDKPGNSIEQEMKKEDWWLNKAKEFTK